MNKDKTSPASHVTTNNQVIFINSLQSQIKTTGISEASHIDERWCLFISNEICILGILRTLIASLVSCNVVMFSML